MEARIGTIGPCQVFRNRYKSSTEAKVALLTALCRLRQRWNCILLRFFFVFFCFLCVRLLYRTTAAQLEVLQYWQWTMCSERPFMLPLLLLFLLPAHSFSATIYTAYHILCHTRYEIFRVRRQLFGCSSMHTIKFLGAGSCSGSGQSLDLTAQREWIEFQGCNNS